MIMDAEIIAGPAVPRRTNIVRAISAYQARILRDNTKRTLTGIKPLKAVSSARKAPHAPAAAHAASPPLRTYYPPIRARATAHLCLWRNACEGAGAWRNRLLLGGNTDLVRPLAKGPLKAFNQFPTRSEAAGDWGSGSFNMLFDAGLAVGLVLKALLRGKISARKSKGLYKGLLKAFSAKGLYPLGEHCFKYLFGLCQRVPVAPGGWPVPGV
ncbi:hypothetical protein GGX14DRAFT_390891 [Mycena pura]|uniref:Uncharacterized protein n=1 Tax=Mycena pura TaxID=153505 RepID=A0AAD6YIT0_9AGAR|nr:hypothetical protein GGX14DRAFT_390891 [Mycena pura]